MMSEAEARQALEGLAKKYLSADPDLDRLIAIIRDKARPGLPVRGVLEEMRKYRDQPYSADDKELIDELLYLYG